MRQHYHSYIRVPQLLSLQHPSTIDYESEAWAAERFFIVNHQVAELHVSQTLLDAQRGLELAAEGRWTEALSYSRRACASMREVIATLKLMRALSSEHFHQFRALLDTASGAQSRQFVDLFRLARYAGRRGATREKLTTSAPGQPECLAQWCDLNNLVLQWRKVHIDIVRHFIKDSAGTGGTTGIEYLKRSMDSHA